MADTTRFTLALESRGPARQRGGQVRLRRRPEPGDRPRAPGLRGRGPLLPRGRRTRDGPGAGGLRGRGRARDRVVHPPHGGHRGRRPGRPDRGLWSRGGGGRPRRDGRTACAVLGGARPRGSGVAESADACVRRAHGRARLVAPARIPGALRRHAGTGAPGRVPHVRRVPADVSAAAHRAPHGQPRRLPTGQFALPAGTRRPVVVDWQTVAWAGASVDVAYFIGGCLSTEDRRTHEPELMARYHDSLCRRVSATTRWRNCAPTCDGTASGC